MAQQKQRIEEAVAKRLNVGAFVPSARIQHLSDPIADTPMVVTLDQLRPYENNPRLTRNPLYDEIKESIRARGLDQPPAITRRTGAEHYIIRNGGNTRLQILGELWRETHEERFFRIHCLFRPWESETSALIGHLAENELHGSLTFIERAMGIRKLKELYEPGENALSLRDLARRLKEDGYPVSFQLVGKMLNCIDFLFPAIPETLYAGLGKHQIEKLLSLRSGLAQLHAKYGNAGDDSGFADFWIAVLSQFDVSPDEFDFTRVQDELLGQMSRLTGQDYRILELDLDGIASGRALLDRTVEIVPPDLDALAAAVKAKDAAPESAPEETVPETPIPSFSPSVPREAPVSVPSGIPESEPPGTFQLQGTVETPAVPPELTEEARRERIAGHIVSPSTTTPRVRQMKEQIARHYGETLPDFEQCAVTAIPVQAGGLADVSDVWYIEQRHDAPEELRGQIFLLAWEIAAYGGLESCLVRTHEGLGFGVEGSLPGDTPRTATVGLLLTGLLRLHGDVPAEMRARLPAALFSQILIGSYGIPVGPNPAEDIGLERLPDVLLIKLFRLIRLARRLVDHVSGHPEGG